MNQENTKERSVNPDTCCSDCKRYGTTPSKFPIYCSDNDCKCHNTPTQERTVEETVNRMTYYNENVGYVCPADDVTQTLQTERQKREEMVEVDTEAIQWAYKKLLAYGTQNSSTGNAMMMDRLNEITHPNNPK